MVRLTNGRKLLRPKHKTLEADIAGQFEAASSDAMQLQPGEEVFRGERFRSTEYVC